MHSRFPTFFFPRLDKNDAKLFCLCKQLYWENAYRLYTDPKQFRIVNKFDTHELAQRHALHLIKQGAQTCVLGELWDPLCVFILWYLVRRFILGWRVRLTHSSMGGLYTK